MHENEETDMHSAIFANNLERVMLLVERDGIDQIFGSGYTPPYWATKCNHSKMVQLLVEQGASLNKVNDSGTTPLITAARHGYLELTRYLLEQGADRDIANTEFGVTALHEAASRGHLDRNAAHEIRGGFECEDHLS